jgi:hypothetical protein
MTAQPRPWAARRLRFALIMLIAGAIIGLIVSVRVTIGATDTPLLGGQYNMATAFLYVLPIVSGITAAIGYRRLLADDPALSPNEQLVAERRGRQLGGRVVAALAVAGLVFAGTAFVFYLLTEFFTGMVVPRGVTVALASFGGGIAGFVVAWWIQVVRPGQLMITGFAFMVIGLMLGILNVYNQQWWQHAISHMSHDSGSAMFFRWALIIGGLVVVAVCEDVAGMYRIAADNGQISRRTYHLLHIGLLAASLGIVGVGLFPTVVSDLSDFLHNVFASLMIGAVMAGMFAIPFFVPALPQSFRIISIGCGVAAVSLFALWAVFGVLIFVIFQILILSLSGAWAIIFLRTTLAFVRETPEGAKQAA